jgi:lauroyl/myristoyl acyltransferase
MPACQFAIAPGRHHVHVDPALSISHQDTKEGLMQHVVERFEAFIAEHPDQWFAFRPMFDS